MNTFRSGAKLFYCRDYNHRYVLAFCSLFISISIVLAGVLIPEKKVPAHGFKSLMAVKVENRKSVDVNTDRGFFILQVSSFRSYQRAVQAQENLISSGEKPYIVKFQSKSAPWFKIRIGRRFSSVIAARHYAEKLLNNNKITEFYIRNAD